MDKVLTDQKIQAELQFLKARIDKFCTDIEIASRELSAIKEDSKEYQQLLNERTRLKLELSNTMDAYRSKQREAEFLQFIGAGDLNTILDNARDQIPQILEREYAELLEFSTAEELVKLGVADIQDGRTVLKANYAAGSLMEELKPHINALRPHEQAFSELFRLIVTGIVESPYTNQEKVDPEKFERIAAVIRERRKPLANIKTFGLMNDKTTARMLQGADIFQQKTDGQLTLSWAVNQAPKGEEEKVPVIISLSLDETGTTKFSKKITAYDLAVHNAVADICYYWYRDNPSDKSVLLTPLEVWRRMNGKQSRDATARPGTNQLQKICRSIDKMRHTDVYMDISAELKKHYIKMNDERLIGGEIRDYMLNCAEVEFVTDQGRKAKGYQIHQAPILYAYSAAKNHVLFLPFDLLDTSPALSDSENVTEFKMYLLQQILLMKNKVRSNNKILLDTLYQVTGILPPEERAEARIYKDEQTKQANIRKLRKADREKIEGLLEVWKGKGWIRGYTALNSKNTTAKARQAVTAYSIKL